MTIKFNAKGTERKRLAESVANYLECDMEYKGAPTFAYQIGHYMVDRNGNLIFDANAETYDAYEVGVLLEILRNDGFEIDPEDEPIGMEITVMIEENDTETFDKVQDIITSKQTLIKHAFGIDRPVVLRTEAGIAFPWFTAEYTPEETQAFKQFTCKLVEMAKNAQRVVAKERSVDNEKYAFRCFLLRLGFIGDEYKVSRKILMRNLTGSSAFKTEKEAE